MYYLFHVCLPFIRFTVLLNICLLCSLLKPFLDDLFTGMERDHLEWLVTHILKFVGSIGRRSRDFPTAHFQQALSHREKDLAFVAYYNRTMAHPFKWTYQGLAGPALEYEWTGPARP